MSAPSASTRNSQSLPTHGPRRRRRLESDEGGSVRQQPQRKRSKLSETPDVDDPNHAVNGDVKPSQPNGHAIPGGPAHGVDFPLRGKAHEVPSRYTFKNDGGTTLTKNDNFTVRQLPAFPSAARSSTLDYTGSVGPSSRFALIVTHDQALVWDYKSTAPTPEALAFPLTHPAKPNEALPIGALVSLPKTRETGLVVVNATTGKITYWQDIENADALSLFEQRRNGFDGSVGNMLSGEKVTRLESVQQAGFVLSFSTGRVAQLLLVDAQSRPAVQVRFLKDQPNAGMFSGLKYVLGGGLHLKQVAGAKLRPSHRREMELIIVNEDANFQFWKVDWPGQTSLRAEVEGAEFLQKSSSSESNSQLRVVDFKEKILDFAFVRNVGDAAFAGPQDDEELGILALVEISSSGSSTYYLLELGLKRYELNPRRTISLKSAPSTASNSTPWRPRLCVPAPFHTAFVVFEKAVTLASLSTMAPGPDVQLLMDTNEMPVPFVDSILLKTGDEPKVIACCAAADANAQHASLLLFVKSVGILDVSAIETPNGTDPIQRAPIRAKSKVEQAVFYGFQINNPLDLLNMRNYNFAVDDVEQASLKLSKEILDSSSPFIRDVDASVANHLEQRANALAHLITHLRQQYPDISRKTQWLLLFDAEKLAAARQVWAVIEKSWKDFPKLYTSPSLFISAIPDNQRRRPAKAFDKEQQGESDDQSDIVSWFFKDVARFDALTPHVYRGLKEITGNSNFADSENLNPIQALSHAHDVLLGAFETAYNFRRANASLYGVTNEIDHRGVVVVSCDGVESVWTSESYVILVTQYVSELSCEVVKAYLEKTEESNTKPSALAEKVMLETPRLASLCIKSFREQINQLYASSNPHDRSSAEQREEEYRKVRFQLITDLKYVDMHEAGCTLGEETGDMNALVELVMHMLYQIRRIQLADGTPLVKETNDVNDRFETYFKQFGSKWVDAVCAYHVKSGRLSPILAYGFSFKDLITKYLRAHPPRRRLEWIHDIRVEEDYAAASHALRGIATSEERDFWSKKVELSIAKLSALASQGDLKSEKGDKDYSRIVDEMALVHIQQRLYDQIRPVIVDALDKSAGLQLTMDSFGSRYTRPYLAFGRLLERGLDALLQEEVLDVDQLVDILTLMDDPETPSEEGIAGLETALALQVIKSSTLSNEPARYDLLLKTIWKRCFLRDDWKSLNKSLGKREAEDSTKLEDTHLFKTFYECYRTGLLNQVLALPPQDVLGAGTAEADHAARFPTTDIQGPLARDNTIQDEALRVHIERHSLEQWVNVARERAEAKVQTDTANATEREKKVEAELDAIADQIDRASLMPQEQPGAGGLLNLSGKPQSLVQRGLNARQKRSVDVVMR